MQRSIFLCSLGSKIVKSHPLVLDLIDLLMKLDSFLSDAHICRPPTPVWMLPQALQSSSGKQKALLAPERAYCLFRLQRLEEAVDVARGAVKANTVDSLGEKRVRALRHVEAQVGQDSQIL